MKNQVVLKRSLAATHSGGATTAEGHSAHPHARTHKPAQRSFPELSQFVVEHLLLLPLGALVALAWANLFAESYFQFTYRIAFFVNEVAMVFFFGLVTKEVVEATAPAGVLHPWRRVALPLAAAPALIVVPALVYVVGVRVVDEPLLSRAWLVPGAVDIAFAYLIARLIFRPRHPVMPFLLLLAIATDALALVLLAVLHPIQQPQPALGATLVALALASAGVLRRSRVKTFWPYVLMSGGLCWCALYLLGVHPALALVPILPFLPHAARDPGFFVDAPPEMKDPLSEFEHWFNYPVQVALFFFGLVNAGVALRALELGTWSVPMAALAGKPLGLTAGVLVALACGLHLPHHVGWRELLVLGLIVTGGFTFALYLAAGVLGPGQLLAETRMGVLLCLGFAPLALVAARLLHVGRFAR